MRGPCVGADVAAPPGGLRLLLLGCVRAARELPSRLGQAVSREEALGLCRQHREHSGLPGFVH